MIDTDESCEAKVISQQGNHVCVSIQTHRFGIHRGKTPILSPRKYRIRRCSARYAGDKEFAISPDIIAVAMQSERKIQVEHLGSRAGLIRQHRKLFLNDPLRVEMVSFCTLIVVASAEPSFLQPGGPRGPSLAAAIGDSAKLGIILDLFVFSNEFPEGLKASRSGLEKKSARELFENTPFVCHDSAVIDKLRLGRPLTGNGAGKFRHAFQINIKFIPEEPGGGRVGAGVKRFV